MERRDILKASAIFLGYGLVGGTSLAVLNGCKADPSTDWKPSFFTQDQISMLAEVAERIIPKTDTPGAKDALVHRYMDDAVRWNYTEEEQVLFKTAIGQFDSIAEEEATLPVRSEQPRHWFIIQCLGLTKDVFQSVMSEEYGH